VMARFPSWPDRETNHIHTGACTGQARVRIRVRGLVPSGKGVAGLPEAATFTVPQQLTIDGSTRLWRARLLDE